MSLLRGGPFFSKTLRNVCFVKDAVFVRSAKTAAAAETARDKNMAIVDKSVQDAEDLAARYNKHVRDAIVRWEKCNEVYYGKERDMTHFPTIKIPQRHPKVRLGFLPDSWFQALYSRTGVTGPYLFLTGSVAFLLSKEIWVVDAHFMEIIPFVVIMTWMIKTFGARASDYLDQVTQKRIDHFYTTPMKKAVANLDSTIKSADEEIARAASVPTLFQAKKENLDLQLEAAYRERLQRVHKMVTRRLDYHVERENVRRRFQQQHMANWITNSVIAGITPTQEKETIRQCIEDLKNLAKTQNRATSPA